MGCGNDSILSPITIGSFQDIDFFVVLLAHVCSAQTRRHILGILSPKLHPANPSHAVLISLIILIHGSKVVDEDLLHVAVSRMWDT